MIYNIDDSNFKEFTDANKEKNIIIDFYTNRCGFCKLEDVIFQSLSQSVKKSKTVIAKCDCDKSENLVEKFVIQSLPTVIILKGDKVISKLEGIVNEEKILKQITDYSQKRNS